MTRFTESDKEMSSRLGLWRVLVPVAIGLCVVVWLFYREFDPEVWHTVHFTNRVIWGIALAWVFMLGSDFGYSWRFRVLTDKELRWGPAVRVCMMCEFTSAITPSTVGGSSLGMIFLHREGVNLGRATTLTMTTLFLDELFFVLSCPLIVAFVPSKELFGFGHSQFEIGIRWVFWCVYALILLWTVVLFVGIIVKPHAIRKALVWLFGFRLLRRWQPTVISLGDSMVATSKDLRHRSAGWWIEAFAATTVSWISRYLVVNALFLGFVPSADQLVVFGRQFVVWAILMFSPTPGGSGVSEWLFTEYYGDMLQNAGIALIIALFWRIITYYVYLIIGVCIVPSWLKKRDKKQIK